ncbi:MAG: hypothetical protein IT343_07420 [Candidatus Melainabacteria bacterium]|jgi:hypothetical protein|nr:hypothetical protein [Candidatus Melainabacteria bacterium]
MTEHLEFQAPVIERTSAIGHAETAGAQISVENQSGASSIFNAIESGASLGLPQLQFAGDLGKDVWGNARGAANAIGNELFDFAPPAPAESAPPAPAESAPPAPAESAPPAPADEIIRRSEPNAQSDERKKLADKSKEDSNDEPSVQDLLEARVSEMSRQLFNYITKLKRLSGL